MPSMQIALSDYEITPNSRTYALAGHTPAMPKVVIQKRTFPSTPDGQARDTIMVVYGTTNAAGDPAKSKVAFELTIRRPGNGNPTDVSAARAVLSDILGSTEFTEMLTSQAWLKSTI